MGCSALPARPDARRAGRGLTNRPGRRLGIELDETAIPVIEPVAGACELLGLDPLYVANEGRLIASGPAASGRAVAAHSPQSPAGGAAGDHRPRDGPACLHGPASRPAGGSRILDLLSGEQMPRIC